jgi:hypothetical protein
LRGPITIFPKFPATQFLQIVAIIGALSRPTHLCASVDESELPSCLWLMGHIRVRAAECRNAIEARQRFVYFDNRPRWIANPKRRELAFEEPVERYAACALGLMIDHSAPPS